MKIQVMMSDEMVERVDFYAKKMGVSRSSFCSVAIGNYVMGLDKSMDIVSILGDKLGDAMLADKTLKEHGETVKQ
jgi:metal-responsive CopG/Arc/MetJ family transcriptional regulator